MLAVSLSASFAAMYVLGFTLNNLTLVALIIAVGFIVDDAIVVVENIHRHLEAGASKVEAALKGAAEIGFTVISISFSLIAAFIPLLFMGGIVGRLFREFAVSVTVAILISVLASLTLAPMLASRFMPALRHADAPKGFAEWLTGGYERGLRWALGHQRLMLVGFAFTVLVAVAGYVGFPRVSSLAGHRLRLRHEPGCRGYLLRRHGRQAPATGRDHRQRPGGAELQPCGGRHRR